MVEILPPGQGHTGWGRDTTLWLRRRFRDTSLLMFEKAEGMVLAEASGYDDDGRKMRRRRVPLAALQLLMGFLTLQFWL
jgi:hypothetical protein